MGVFIDLSNEKFGSLTVIKRADIKGKEAMWECICECGKEITTRGSSLRNGASQSCGCSRLEHLINRPPKKTHGGSQKERLYRIWRGMIDRCYYPSHNRFKNYGGRGITICDEWKNDYSAFRDWAVANGYNPEAQRGKCTIDRIDVNGQYEPDNCRWVDMKIQNNNKKVGGF